MDDFGILQFLGVALFPLSIMVACISILFVGKKD